MSADVNAARDREASVPARRLLRDAVAARVFPAAVAEVDHQDLWQRCALGVAVVSGTSHHVDELLQSVRQQVDATHGAELLDWQEQRA